MCISLEKWMVPCFSLSVHLEGDGGLSVVYGTKQSMVGIGDTVKRQI